MNVAVSPLKSNLTAQSATFTGRKEEPPTPGRYPHQNLLFASTTMCRES
jgi:hypothetical protein